MICKPFKGEDQKRLKIRSAKQTDAAPLTRLAFQLGYDFSQKEGKLRLRNVLQDNSQKIFVCEINRQVVGWIHVCRCDRFLSDTFAEVAGFIVDKNRRFQGIGTALLNQVEQWAISHDIQIIRIRSNILRKQIVTFYENRGYQITKTQNVFYKNKEK